MVPSALQLQSYTGVELSEIAHDLNVKLKDYGCLIGLLLKLVTNLAYIYRIKRHN